jgi:hypothetical protein
MNYIEIKMAEEAFEKFLTRQNCKTLIKVQYYHRLNQLSELDCAFIGYETDKGGFHGVHYIKQRDSYYFGTRNKGTRENPTGLNFSQIAKIPMPLKMALANVSKAKKGMIMKKGAEGWINI